MLWFTVAPLRNSYIYALTSFSHLKSYIFLILVRIPGYFLNIIILILHIIRVFRGLISNEYFAWIFQIHWVISLRMSLLGVLLGLLSIHVLLHVRLWYICPVSHIWIIIKKLCNIWLKRMLKRLI